MYISLSQLNGYIPEERKRVQEQWEFADVEQKIKLSHILEAIQF